MPEPAKVLDLSKWKLNVPVEEIDQIQQPALATYQSRDFSTYSQVVFTSTVTFNVRADGWVQPGASYPRSELREMNPGGTTNAAWNSASGTHVMEVTQRINHLPTVRPRLVCGQIHNTPDYLYLTVLDGTRLYAKFIDTEIGNLDTNYQPGTWFDHKVEVINGSLKIYHNGVLKATTTMNQTGCYFKAGCYLQSNLTYDLPAAYGEVEISALTITHS